MKNLNKPNTMNAITSAIGKLTLVVVGAIIALGLLLSWPLMLLWNGCIVGTIDGVGPLESVWHAWGVMILSGLLFNHSGISTRK